MLGRFLRSVNPSRHHIGSSRTWLAFRPTLLGRPVIRPKPSRPPQSAARRPRDCGNEHSRDSASDSAVSTLAVPAPNTLCARVPKGFLHVIHAYDVTGRAQKVHAEASLRIWTSGARSITSRLSDMLSFLTDLGRSNSWRNRGRYSTREACTAHCGTGPFSAIDIAKPKVAGETS